MRYLGRKAELTTILRGIGELPGRGARPGRPGRQRGAAGARGAARSAPRRARVGRARARRLAADAIDVTLPGSPAVAGRLAQPADPHDARDRGRLRRPRLPRHGGPRGRARLLQLHGAQPSARATPRGWRRTRSTSTRRRSTLSCAWTAAERSGSGRGDPLPPGPRTSSCAPTPRRCRCARWRRRSRRSSSSSRAAAIAATPSTRPTARCSTRSRASRSAGGHHARRPQGHARRVRAGDLRARARDALSPRLLPVHRAERRGRRLLLRVRRLGHACRRLARPDLQGDRLDRDPRLGDGRPERLRLRRGERLRPRARPGLRVRDGDRADRDAQARRPRPAQVLRERRPRAGAVPMRVPYSWLREYCDPGLDGRGARRARSRCGAPRSSGSRHVGPPSADGLRRRHAWSRSSSTPTPTGSASARSTPATARARSSAARRTSPPGRPSPVALPGAMMPGGEKLGQAKLRGVVSDGMILSEAELEIGEDADGIVVLRRRRRPGDAAGRGAAGRRAGARARGQLQPRRLPRRLRRRARGARDHRARRWPRRRGRATPRRRARARRRDYASVTVEVPGALPALHRARLHRRRDRPLAAVAQGAADGGRPAADQQRRRHHQLRDADDRPAAARLRPRQGARAAS